MKIWKRQVLESSLDTAPKNYLLRFFSCIILNIVFYPFFKTDKPWDSSLFPIHNAILRKYQSFSAVFVVCVFIFNILSPYIALADNEWWYEGGQQIGATTNVDPAPANTEAKPDPKNCNQTQPQSKPVFLFNGEETYECVDLVIPGRGMDVIIKHHYRSGRNFNGAFGFGWTLNYFERLKVVSGGNVLILDGAGRKDEYQFQGGQYIPPPGFYQTLVQETSGTWTLTQANGDQKIFDINGNLSAIRDRNANQITFTYDALGSLPIIGRPLYLQIIARVVMAFDYRLSKITDTVGRDINLFYNADGRLQRITDFTGRNVTYTYDANTDDLLTITRPATPQYPGLVKAFTYDSSHNLRTITDPKNQAFVTNHYDSQERVERQDLGQGSFQFDYSVPNQTTVTDRNGNVVKYNFNTNGNMLRKEEFTRNLRPSDPTSYVTAYTYNSNLEMTSVTFPKGNGIKYTYDETNPNVRARGNLLEIRRKADMSQPDNNINDLVITLTHEQQANQVKTVTDPRGNTTTYLFDYEFPSGHILYGTRANIVGIQSPAVAGGVPLKYFLPNQYGQVIASLDSNFVFNQYDYDPTTGYLQRVIQDPGGINAVAAFTYDPWGNFDTITDAENRVTDLDFNELGWLVQEKNQLNVLTKYSYDKNGNLEKLERQANTGATLWQTTSFTYDILNNLKTITDPLSRLATLNYDNNENLVSVLDAELHTTAYEFDERNRLFKVRDANTPTGVTRYDYDINRNLRKITDGSGNPTDYAYDLFDREERVTYADGRFSQVTYDKNANMINRQVPSLANIVYGYDAF